MPYKDKEKAKEYRKRYYRENKIELNKRSTEQYKNNVKKIKEQRKKHYEENRETILQKGKQWAQDNFEKVKKYRKKHHLKNRTKILRKQKEWYERNKERQREKSKKYYIYNSEDIKQHHKKPKIRYILYKSKARSRGFTFNLTSNEFSKIINEPCYYCGGNGYGIDRLDNSIGYLLNNVVSCCSMCNYMKRAYTEEDFINQCIKIVDNIERGRFKLV